MKSKNLKVGITVKVKSWEEIQKTFTNPNCTDTMLCAPRVKKTCGDEFTVKEVKESFTGGFSFVYSGKAHYHPKWLKKL